MSIKLFINKKEIKKVLYPLAPLYRLMINSLSFLRFKKIFNINRKRLLNVKISSPKVWYFCVPTHPNLGDQAQACCINKWLSENFTDMEIIEILHNGSIYYDNCFTDKFDNRIFELIKDKISEKDLIFFQSGYYDRCSSIPKNLFKNNTILSQ